MIRPEDVTIIIPHLGATPEQEYALRECMQSLQETVPDIKKIIVENGKSSFHFSHSNMTGIKNYELITLDAQGQCKSVNAAVATTNTPWIFVTNDDMIYAPGWFERLVDAWEVTGAVDFGQELSKYPQAESLNPIVIKSTKRILGKDILCISPRLVEPRPGAPTFEVFFAGGAGGDFDKEKWLLYAEKHTEHQYQLQTGFNLPFLIKRELWDTIGGYDISYDPWGSNSDSDLEYKIRLAGVQPYQNPNSVVYHFSTTSGTAHPSNRSYWEKNWHYFINFWGFERASSPEIWTADFHIPTKEEGRKFFPTWENKYA